MRKIVKIGSILITTLFMSVPVQVDTLQDEFIESMAEGLNARWTYDDNEDIMSRSEFVEYRTQLVNEVIRKL